MSDKPPSPPDPTTESQQQQQQIDMVQIPRTDYESLVKASMMSLQNEWNTLDDFDKIVSTLINCQIFVMNLKAAKKKSMTGKDNNTDNNKNSDVQK